MRRAVLSKAGRQEGFTLAESLISSSLLLLGLLLALGAYDAGRRALERAEGLAEQQQSARSAFDQLVSHLRAAGLGENPDGNQSRPDEGIEAAYDTAISVRADFDGTDSADAATPEASLAGAAFESVSTGNDEIVTYALAKGDGSDTGSLTFTADVRESPRNGTVETVTVSGITLVPNDPPYTLYRITLNNDPTKWGSGTFLVRSPIMDNVLSLTFRYYDAAGVLLNPGFDPVRLPDDMEGADSGGASLARSRIRRIRVELVGLTRDPDPTFRDLADPNPATRSHRKLRITADVTPRNLGWFGARDLDVANRSGEPRPGSHGA